MRILVTGSNGLLGQKITDACIEDPKIQLLATSVGANRHPVKSGYRYLELDICDSSRLRELVDAERPDCIINTAAVTNVDACETDRERCWQLNVDAVREMASLCKELGIHLIQLSTDFIFDGKNGPYRENDPARPLSQYGLSKLESEQSLQESGCKWTIIRTILVYGVVADMSRSNIVLWAKESLEHEKPLQVVNDQWRMPTLAEDLASTCLSAARREATGVFHVSGPELLSVHEIINQIADFWGLDKGLITPVSSDTLSQLAPRPAKTGFILDKSARELEYRPHTFREGLALVDTQLRDRIARSKSN